jgi:hypothetical protein
MFVGQPLDSTSNDSSIIEVHMSLFAGIKNAQVTSGGNYMRAGTHALQLLKLTQGRTRKGVDFVAADFRVLNSTNEEHPEGSTVNWFAGADKDGFLSNVKALAVAILSSHAGEMVDENTVDEDVMEGLVAEGGAEVSGAKLNADAFLVDTRRGGKFTKIIWAPVFGE